MRRFDAGLQPAARYPEGFLWGSATSAHQVEGGCTNNNWSAFEHATDARGSPRIAGGQRSGDACQHWDRFREDIGLMKAIGLNAYRFSVEWSKIEEREGVFNEDALEHYAEVVEALRGAAITPVITLHHFTHPLWLEHAGGFLRDDAPELFTRFVRKVYARLSTRVPLWYTINEPAVMAVNGYVTGEFPPGTQDIGRGLRVLRNLLRAHTAAYVACKELNPEPSVGIATNMFVYAPASRWNPLDRLAARIADQTMNGALLEYLVTGKADLRFAGYGRERWDTGVRNACDIVGINYYTRFFLRLTPWHANPVRQVTRAPEDQLTDMGWEIYPEGLLEVLRMAAERTGLPLIVTENGIADADDRKRALFIRDHLGSLDRALQQGIDVRGYFYWTLMDNFEWAHGFSKRFGLYNVDVRSQQRTLREGSRALAAHIQAVARQD